MRSFTLSLIVSIVLLHFSVQTAFSQSAAPSSGQVPPAEQVPPAGIASSAALSEALLKALRDDDIPGALKLLEAMSAEDRLPAEQSPRELTAGSAGLHRALMQLGSDEQYELLHQWSIASKPEGVRVLTSLVPEIVPPMEFARALGQRPKKESFAVATVGDVPGIFCSAWSLIVAADDAGNLRKLITQLEALSEKKISGADFVLTLAKIRDTRTSDAELTAKLTARVAPADAATQNAALHDAVLVAAALQRTALGPVCEQIVERLNQFTFTSGSPPYVSFLRRLRATVILKNRSPDTAPEAVFYQTPGLWIAADDPRHDGLSAGSDRAIWLFHEEHVKRLAGPGNDLLLFRYPLIGTFELKGEATALDHGAVGMTYGGLGFDASQQFFTLREIGRSHAEQRTWPFLAPPELRMFNRVNIRVNSEKVVFLSNLHPGWTGDATTSASSPWLGLRATGEGRIYFRNLEIVGDPTIPREVRIADASDLRGWGATYGETVPRATIPFQSNSAAAPVTEPADWQVVEGILNARMATNPTADEVSQSHLAYMRPLLEGESVKYEFFHEEGKMSVHPALGRLAFLIEPGGVRVHWLTDEQNEWTGLPADNAIVEPLNRRGPRSMPLKNADWNAVTMTLRDNHIVISLNDVEIYDRLMEDLVNHHIGFYHDRNSSAVQIRNVVLSGNWPEKLSAEQLQKLVSMED